MYNNRNIAFLSVAVAQLLTISYLFAEPAWTMNHGQVVTLKTTPVDPVDLFRGEYANLSYDIGHAPSTMESAPGRAVYTVLSKQKDGKEVWTAQNYSFKPLKAGPGQVLMVGRMGYEWDRNGNGGTRVRYGIERLYMKEGTSKALEHRGGKLDVEVVVSSSGQPLIKRVLEGKQVLYDGTKTLDF